MRVADLFAGAGGFTLGAALAGCTVVWASNHWPIAVEVHQQNHPDTLHVCQDLTLADWRQVPRHDVLVASPSCQGHSKARGKERPHHDASRATAWAVVDAVESCRPEALVVENVEGFRRWRLYRTWKQALRELGYALEEHVVDAADLGVPQHRRRLFVVGVRGLAPVGLQLPTRPRVPAASVMRWDLGRWSKVHKKGRSPKTLARIAQGRLDHGDRFLVAYYGTERGGRSLQQPLGTVTTRDRFAVVDGDRMRMLHLEEYREAMGFPSSYHLPDDHKLALHLLGNAVVPRVAGDVVGGLVARLRGAA